MKKFTTSGSIFDVYAYVYIQPVHVVSNFRVKLEFPE